MAGWLDRQLRRIRSASSDAELEAVRAEMEEHLPPALVNGTTRTNDLGLSLGNGADDGTHLHLHLGGGGGGQQNDQGMTAMPMQQPPMTGDQPPPQNGPAPPNAAAKGGDVETRMAALEAAVATLTQQMSQLTNGDDGSEEEVQLEEPETKDARSYIMRRGGKIKKVGDEELLVPVKTPVMMGETDLPGIQDLNTTVVHPIGVVKTGDSFNMEGLWQDVMAKAEIIAPGIRVPTFDGRVTQEVTTKRLCSFRKQTLDAAIDDEGTKEVVKSLTDIGTHLQVRNLSCDSTRMAFNVIAGALGQQRNQGAVRASVGDSRGAQRQTNGTPSIAEIQRRNKEAWKTGEFKRPTN
jgi:hypothetical protein